MVTTCRRGDRSTKFAAANPPGGGLNYSPIISRELFTKVRGSATFSQQISLPQCCSGGL